MAIFGVLIALVVVVALAIALAPYILSILGWTVGLVAVALVIGVSLYSATRAVVGLGTWFDRTRLGRWQMRRAVSAADRQFRNSAIRESYRNAGRKL